MTTQQLLEYTIQRIGQMAIAEHYKLELLGLLSAIQYRVENGEEDETDRRGQGTYQD